MKSLSCVRLLATPWTAAYQAPPSMGFSRQEYWSAQKGETVPDSLPATPKSPPTRRVPPRVYSSSGKAVQWFSLGDFQLPGQESQASSCLRKGTPLASRVAQGVSVDGRAWWAAVHGVARSRTRLSDFTLFFHFRACALAQAARASQGTKRPSSRIERRAESLASPRDGQGGLACCDSWGHKESDTTERLN